MHALAIGDVLWGGERGKGMVGTNESPTEDIF